MNTSLIQKSGTRLTSSNLTEEEKKQRIEADPLAKTIISIMNAMKADYGRIYAKQFDSDEAITYFKRRLYQKLKSLSLDAIVEGYELCSSRAIKFCPTVPEIVAAVLETVKIHKKRDENKAEADRISALPAPTITCKPAEMLAKAKKSAPIEETAEERKIRRAEMQKNHEALLTLAGSRINRGISGHNHTCEYGGCMKIGTISRAITGKGNFYCAEHFRMT